MSDLAANLNALAKALEQGLVTRAEAAERLRMLAARVPIFVVCVQDPTSQETALYPSTAGSRQGALIEAGQALGSEAIELVRDDASVQVVPAKPCALQKRGGARGGTGKE
jgi:hypothetical protein